MAPRTTPVPITDPDSVAPAHPSAKAPVDPGAQLPPAATQTERPRRAGHGRRHLTLLRGGRDERGITTAESFDIVGTGISASGVINNASGSNVITGAVTLTGSAQIGGGSGAGNLLTLSGGIDNGGNLHDPANCAVRVHIELQSDSQPGPLPFTVTQDVHIRNRLPGNVGCG